KFPKSILLAGITVSVSLVRMSQGTEFPPLDKGDRMNNPDRDKRINRVIPQKVTRSGRVQDFQKKSSFIAYKRILPSRFIYGQIVCQACSQKYPIFAPHKGLLCSNNQLLLRSENKYTPINQSETMSNAANIGKITQVIGPVVDVSFENHSHMPSILDALEVIKPNGQKVVLETQQHLGEDRVRTIAMEGTEGLQRGMEVIAKGAPIKMPIGEQIKGRLFNVVGDAIDGLKQVDKDNGLSIHRAAPKFEDLATGTEILYTGIKVIDL